MTRGSSTQAQASRDWKEIRTGWRVLVAATLGVMLGFPTLAVQTLGVFAPFLASTFKWSFSEIMGGLVIVTVVVIVIGPITGYLCDRYGARPLVFDVVGHVRRCSWRDATRLDAAVERAFCCSPWTGARYCVVRRRFFHDMR